MTDEADEPRDSLRVLLADGYSVHEIVSALLAEVGHAGLSSVEAAVAEYYDAEGDE